MNLMGSAAMVAVVVLVLKELPHESVCRRNASLGVSWDAMLSSGGQKTRDAR